MARRTSRPARRASVSRRAPSGRGGGAAKYVLPAVVVAGLAFLLWPKPALAETTTGPKEPLTPPPPPPPPPPAQRVPVPPAPAGVLPVSAQVRNDEVNLRAAPTTNSAVLRTLEKDLRVQIPNTNDLRHGAGETWYGVIVSPGVSGWVASRLLGNFVNLPANAAIAGYAYLGRNW